MSQTIFWRLVRLDFRERVRRGRFLRAAAATAALGTLFVPGRTGYVVLTVDGYRGIYNSAWVGASVALVTTTFLSLFGFYLVGDAVQRDRQTGVGQVLAATPMTKAAYIMSRALSNLALLSALVGVLAVVAAGMQILRGEAPAIEPWPLLAPFLLVTLPGLAVIAALAVLFECIRPLQGTRGNVLYFFVWLTMLALSLSAAESAPNGWAFDVFGMGLLVDAIRSALRGYASPTGAFVLLGIGENAPDTFVWEGISWSPQLIAVRLLWIPVAALITALAIPLFDRFEVHPDGHRTTPKRHAIGPIPPETAPEVPTWLKEGPEKRAAFALAPLVYQELRLMLKGNRFWWRIGAVVLTLLTYVVPEQAMRWVWLLAWLWPVGLWSQLATKEASSRTEDLILATPHTLRRHLPAAWLAGLLVALLTGSGAIARLALSQSWAELAACLVGAAFIPSLALALGAAIRNEKPFQILYLLLWYLGPVEGVAYLDFVGLHQESLQLGVPVLYLILTPLLLIIAALAHRRQAWGS